MCQIASGSTFINITYAFAHFKQLHDYFLLGMVNRFLPAAGCLRRNGQMHQPLRPMHLSVSPIALAKSLAVTSFSG